MIKVGHDLTDAEIAARYDAFGGELSMHSDFYPAVAEFIGDVRGQRVLDAGCGAGQLLVELHRRNPTAELYGLEISSANVDKARTHLGDAAHIMQASLTNLPPLPAAFFDTVILTEVLEHLRSPLQALLALKPLLKPQGAFVITFPNSAAWLPFSGLAALLAPLIRPMRGFLPHEHPLRTEQPIDTVFSQHEVFAILHQAGLRITDRACRETFPYVLEFFYKFGRMANPPRMWQRLDRWVSQRGWTVLGYRIFVRCQPIQAMHRGTR
ncbi:class I SAM-dependent methyltransferase [Candidatus Roseilinea sp. NK_OTU-006]|jgi:2-polyprenyl-3-methyl-5-hydroxy-6-metoxy-1,4-benzoquinol methylase|uniref:class I SAM-dependent methyltransferase n=1 Tax=Candidatus Roseilinea sp. NK_OTU-006 TaxID=2704250 RepID=UPI00145EA17B|nr:class I SAM-dependent methyltransferase [Candidatus Roseilinea sp. NK_OTU-006]